MTGVRHYSNYLKANGFVDFDFESSGPLDATDFLPAGSTHAYEWRKYDGSVFRIDLPTTIARIEPCFR